MKYTDKEYKKYNIDLSECNTYDDVLVCTVDGNVKNGAKIDKHMLNQYCNIKNKQYVKDLIDDILKLGNTIRFDNNGFSVCTTEVYDVDNDQEVVVSDNNVVIKKKSLLKRFWNWLTNRNK